MKTPRALLEIKDRLWTFATFAVFGLLAATGAALTLSSGIPDVKRFLVAASTLLLGLLAAGSLRWVICATPRLVATAQGITVRGMLFTVFIPWRDVETIDVSSVTVKVFTTPVVRLGLRPGARRAFSFWTRLLEHQSGDEYLIALRGTGLEVNDVAAALRQVHAQFALQKPAQSAI